MQEKSCTVRGNQYDLPAPFFVLATQNPIELEGTYPLPEAQLDRFLVNTVLDYLSADDEMKVVGLTTSTGIANPQPVTTAEEIISFQQLVRMVPVSDSVARYAVDIVRMTRPTDSTAPDFIKKYVNFGASVRGIQNIILAAKARALMHRRYHVTSEDVAALAVPVLRHRILLNFHAESDRLKQDDILKRVLEAKPFPKL
jgi:MoxR-like ATPase